eukprot:Gregarina_sp_Poly_1__10275@NODE_720_length_6610_cov_190_458811_g542_i0_p2_GENE_NODE_720_length_6610_cov_190_458811_g542_i0NODE_720_length_6610_cov_190_458811_g542_i0_p2_ORF_typecomplete_len844_score113_11zf_CCCH_4/PF18345_1/1_3e03zf_CCCH_4/PF18345_1/0_00048zf_CCCH_4/PF18345_1/9e02zfCCCH/PF00642_24/5zfCCCH/PF00642_24/0_35zfCCCH/PF00642_24/3_2e02zfCCCH/PF00642_24/9e03zfCCCH_3/PF15663_5/1_2e02zfCCCH_3/PF15663_5/13_NODE_720_length_6610_cov_190_458811_g542_i039526483
MPNANHPQAGTTQSSRSRNRNRHHGNASNVEPRKSNSSARQTPFFSSPSLGSELNLVSQMEGSGGGTPAHAHTTTHQVAMSINASGGFFEAPYAPPLRGPANATGNRNLMNSNFGSLSKESNRPGGFRSPTGANMLSPGQWFPTPAGILPELAAPQNTRQHPMSRAHRERRLHHCNRHSSYGNTKGGSLVPSPPPACLNLIYSLAGDSLLFSETNMDWTKLNIFRTRLCDRLTQTHTCHMANRCLFSHDVNWPRRTPFLPRATALTLRYIPVWCPRLSWPPLLGLCDSSGKISWTSSDGEWDARSCHQRCTRGDNCPFVHNVEEFLYHPEVYKTRSCCLANDDNFEEQMNSNCVALCPWYFCPFAHDVYELRDLRASRFAWHPPPQIVDNQFVARTQDFNDLELRIIEFVRKSTSGSFDLYTSPQSPLRQLVKLQMPAVIRPISGSSLEQLTPSSGHRENSYDDLLYTMVTASFLNLLLYPVENFYVPTLLSLQCAVVQSQLQIAGTLNCAELLCRYDARSGSAAGSGSFSPAADEGGATAPESPRLRADLDERRTGALTPRSPSSKQPPMLPLGNLNCGDFDGPLSYRQFVNKTPEPSSGRSARNLYSGRHGSSQFPHISRRASPTQTPVSGTRGSYTSPTGGDAPKSPGGGSTNRRTQRQTTQRSAFDPASWKTLETKSPRGADTKKTDLSVSGGRPRSSISVDSRGGTAGSSVSPEQSLPLLVGLEETALEAPSPNSSADEDLFPADSPTHASAADDSAGLKAILDILKPEEILQMMTIIQQTSQQQGEGGEPVSSTTRDTAWDVSGLEDRQPADLPSPPEALFADPLATTPQGTPRFTS